MLSSPKRMHPQAAQYLVDQSDPEYIHLVIFYDIINVFFSEGQEGKDIHLLQILCHSKKFA